MPEPQDRKLYHLCLRVIRANQHLIEIQRTQLAMLNNLFATVNKASGRKRSPTTEVQFFQEAALKIEEAGFEIQCAWGDLIADDMEPLPRVASSINPAETMPGTPPPIPEELPDDIDWNSGVIMEDVKK
jgi:hypothetical protein